ncbi:Mitochondrial arginine transporter BAC2 [Linum grandiflorum]
MDELLKNHLFATHALAGAGSVALGTALTYPLDTIKVLTQVGSSSNKQLAPLSVLRRVQSLSGNSGVYNGLGWLTSARIVGLGARFGVYEILTAFNKDGREYNNVYVHEALIAGMVAGAVESLASSPFEFVKLRAQVTSASRVPSSTSVMESRAVVSKLLHGYTPDVKALNQSTALLSTLSTKHPDLVGALREYPWMMTGSGRPPSVSDVCKVSNIVSLEGWSAFWRGIRSGIARDSVFGGIFFCSWQFLHRAMLDWKAVGMVPEPRFDDEIGPLSPLAVSAAAGFSGSIAAAASHGFDTAKCRFQCTVLPKYLQMERALLKWRRPGTRFERATGIHPADRNLLLRGIWLRMARSGIASFVIVGSYYLAVDQLL